MWRRVNPRLIGSDEADSSAVTEILPVRILDSAFSIR